MAIALSIWYEDFTPCLEQLNRLQLARAGYLLDRLMRYNCLSERRKLELLNIVNFLKAQRHSLNSRVSERQVDNLQKHDVELLALTWGLNEDISRLTPHLLQYQSRHYQLSRTSK